MKTCCRQQRILLGVPRKHNQALRGRSPEVVAWCGFLCAGVRPRADLRNASMWAYVPVAFLCRTGTPQIRAFRPRAGENHLRPCSEYYTTRDAKTICQQNVMICPQFFKWIGCALANWTATKAATKGFGYASICGTVVSHENSRLQWSQMRRSVASMNGWLHNMRLCRPDACALDRLHYGRWRNPAGSWSRGEGPTRLK
jgi:hypothetical protein